MVGGRSFVIHHASRAHRRTIGTSVLASRGAHGATPHIHELAANITGTARMSANPPSMIFALKANIIGRASGYAHADQPAPPAPLDPYGGLST